MENQIPSLSTPGNGYTMQFIGGWEAGQQTDNLPYFFGSDCYNSARTLLTGFPYASCRIPKDGTIKNMFIRIRMATVGASETVSHYIRVNNNTDVGQIDLQYNINNVSGAAYNVNHSVVEGDEVAFKIQSPTWVTNPVGIRCYALIYIE